MKQVSIFEDLIAWQKARELTKEIYRVTAAGKFEKDFGLRSQIERASVSIISNIAEGFDRLAAQSFINTWLLPKVHVQKLDHNYTLRTT